MKAFLFTLISLSACQSSNRSINNVAETGNDERFLWLENVDSKEALAWVEEQNKKSTGVLQDRDYKKMNKKILSYLNDKNRIPEGSIHNGYVYNFWKDEKNIKGLWRRAKLSSYNTKNPQWETILDVDALAKKENESWVFKEGSCLEPAHELCVLNLSKGGKDAVVRREFDIKTKSFVSNGFITPESKGGFSWIEENTAFISMDFGDGTLTDSGYPRQLKVWKRGQDLKEAKLIKEIGKTDLGLWGFTIKRPEGTVLVAQRSIDFYHSQVWIVNEKYEFNELMIPDDSELKTVFNGLAIVALKSDWKINDSKFNQGAVVAIELNKFLEKPKGEFVHLMFEPDSKTMVESISTSKSAIYVSLLENVQGKILKIVPNQNSKIEFKSEVVPLPGNGVTSLVASNDFEDEQFAEYENFVTPPSLYYFNNDLKSMKVVKTLPVDFNGKKYSITQKFATSKDGTKIPYFLVHKKGVKLNSKNPTLLYGYGGFEVPLTPYYSRTIGNIWLEKGGVYVLSNIRGGGEFGPKWHQAALRENRQRAYDDFFAIAEQIIADKVTSPKNLGIMGGSNGGLLMGVAFTQRPDLFNAVVCQVPLLDMLRFHKLLAGASWMGEYGNPDVADDRKFIEKYSPFQNVHGNKNYPNILFTTSTRDDRVHPGHARKMYGKMLEMNHNVLLYENIEGGHAGAADNIQKAKMSALSYNFLWKKLK